MRIQANRLVDGNRSVAWYRLVPQRWNWRSEADRDGLIYAGAQILADLVDHRLHFRVTTAASTRNAWASRLAVSRQALLSWDAHASSVAEYLTGLNFHDKAAFVGVEYRRRLFGKARNDDLDKKMARSGFDAQPLTPDSLEWLLRRSVLLGHPSPTTSGLDVPWDDDDMAEITDSAQWTSKPFQRSVMVWADGEVRNVVTCVVGRMQTLSSAEPWLCVADRLAFPVEISAIVDVLRPEHVRRGARTAMLRSLSQRDHYAEHGLPPPPQIQAGIDSALEVQAQLDEGFGTDLSTRVEGWYRLAVSGATEAEALERADQVAALYGPQVTIVRPSAQYALAREFVPGARLSNTAHRRRMPVTTAAGAMPQATASVGHPQGIYLGYTSVGGRHAVLWDTHRAMEERERSGLTLVAGVPGSGKSSLLFQVVYQSTLAGVKWVVLDPAGATARLVDLPELSRHARHTDLMNAVPGTLNPFRVISAPHPRDFESDAAYKHAVGLVEHRRRQLCMDILLMFLPPMIADDKDTRVALSEAIRKIPADHGASPRQVIDQLHADGAHVVANFLEDISRLPAAQLVFPTGHVDLDYSRDDEDIRLEVVTMRGLVLPRAGISRNEYSSEEQMSAPLLQLAAFRTAQLMYAGEGRKGIAIDECWQLARTGAGRSLLDDLARQSRKMNTRVLLATQQVGDILSSELSNLVDSAFMMRLEDPQAQQDALKVMRVPADYGAALGTLSRHTRGSAGRSGSREAVFADGEGGVERIVIDLGHLPPHVRLAADTTPLVPT